MTLPKEIRGVVWDWGDTLMRDIAGQAGPMVDWPHVETMPGAAEALEALSGIPTHCVASNATESGGAEIEEALERVGLGRYFDHFFASSEMGVSKPDPSFFQEVSRRLGIAPEYLLAVGNDLARDIEPAKAAGMITVWVSLGDGDGEWMGKGVSAEGPADLVVDGLIDLASLAGESVVPGSGGTLGSSG